MRPSDAQRKASNPAASVFVAANAGSGKTATLVDRVARLLLAGADPAAILCVTFTKAAAAEMQRRLFDKLGDWAVMEDAPLAAALAEIDEAGRDLREARRLFARALETPGGLKIQTIHAFCEKLLRRFPLEAGVSPGFTVLEDAAAAEASRQAREDVAAMALMGPDSITARAYAQFSVALDWRAFNAMFADFETRRAAIGGYLARCAGADGVAADVWRACGFSAPTSADDIETAALGLMRWDQWTRAADALRAGSALTDGPRGEAMAALGRHSSFAEVWAIFCTAAGKPRDRLATKAVESWAKEWLEAEQKRLAEVCAELRAATVAADTVLALALAGAYADRYEAAKLARSGLDFGDLIERTLDLITRRADAAWVLYKLDGGIEHVLLDEAQDTAPAQWDILRALTAEFFTGAGSAPAGRTLFAVGDEKQSIFSFQGAVPERLALESRRFGAVADEAGAGFVQVPLIESFRSAPEILAFVDKVFAPKETYRGLLPAGGESVAGLELKHTTARGAGGCVELWPMEADVAGADPDPWAPVDAGLPRSKNKELARRIARAVVAMVERGEAVMDRQSGAARPVRFGDVLILVRRRNALFFEIIRALKREGAPVGGADRLKLSEHGVFKDLIGLARFACFPADDLTLAALLRSPFCEVGEESLFDLAHGRAGSLWRALGARADERDEWRDAAAFLAWAREEASRAAPFDFYGRVMGRLDGAGRSMRQRILTRLGAEGEDALDAFLAQALAAESADVRDLETFVARMAATDIEVKREAQQGPSGSGGEVRAMTVHGAKGLEAPIVILPDTTIRATDQGGPLLATAAGGFLWARKADDCLASDAARQEREAACERESSRLLYVALTRARDRLIVAGVVSQPSRFERSWYAHVQTAFDALPIRAFPLEGGAQGWRFGVDPAVAPSQAAPAEDDDQPPAWTRGLAPGEPPLARWASPSTVTEMGPESAVSPLAVVGGLGRYRRGDLIHRLLQLLPDLAPERRADAAALLLARELDLTADQRAEMAAAALAVLADPRFSAVFGPGSRPEVALAGVAAGIPLSGRVDRLLVETTRVLVVDFKTNRPAPARIEDAPGAYVTQMALYGALLATIFPGRAVEAALVWTDGPRLMAVPQPMMDEALEALASHVPSSSG